MKILILMLLFLNLNIFAEVINLGGLVPEKIDVLNNEIIMNFSPDYEIFTEINEDGSLTIVVRIK